MDTVVKQTGFPFMIVHETGFIVLVCHRDFFFFLSFFGLFFFFFIGKKFMRGAHIWEIRKATGVTSLPFY